MRAQLSFKGKSTFYFSFLQEENSREYKKVLKEKLKPFADFLGNKKFFISNEITFADFHMYELLDVLKTYSPESFEDFPNLVEFTKRFEELPKIKAYMESPRFAQ